MTCMSTIFAVGGALTAILVFNNNARAFEYQPKVTVPKVPNTPTTHPGFQVSPGTVGRNVFQSGRQSSSETGKPSFGDFSVQKSTDVASPSFFEQAVTGGGTTTGGPTTRRPNSAGHGILHN